MKQYLIDTFRFNDWANKRTLEAMRKMTDNRESVNLFSYLIRAQDKWIQRIENDPAETEIKWFAHLSKAKNWRLVGTQV